MSILIDKFVILVNFAIFDDKVEDLINLLTNQVYLLPLGRSVY